LSRRRRAAATGKTAAPGSFPANWGGCLAAAAGAIAVATGTISWDNGPTPAGIVFVIILGLAISRYFYRLNNSGTRQGAAVDFEGPLLLVVLSWTVFRLGASVIPYLIFMPAATIAWIVVRYPLPAAGLCVLTGVLMEAGLTMAGLQSTDSAAANILLCLAAATALHFFPGSKLFRRQVQDHKIQTRHAITSKEQVRELGLETGEYQIPDTFISSEIPDVSASYSQRTIDSISASFELQLEMIRRSFDLTTIAVLWPSPDGQELRLRYLSSSRKDILQGPYPSGIGITGGLTAGRQEAELAPVKPSHPVLPYYRRQENVGAAIALRISTSENEGPGDNPDQLRVGILCADRRSSEPWSDKERQVLRLAARKLGLEVVGSRLLLNMDRERSATHRLYLGLKELNSGLTLESVLAASIKAVKAQLPAELVAISLINDKQHRVELADGPEAAKLVGQEFPLEEGLVGQAIKTGRVLPAGGRYMGPPPIFSAAQLFPEYKSILVIPLKNESGERIGALTTAATTPGLFNRNRQEILELIATQVAVKIELGQAHEQLGKMATTDGLTGLANHRAFQHNFDVMLDRSKRTGTPLCLMMSDLDHFKQVNDSYGHPFGDLVLQQVAKVLADTVRTVDLAARYGGEEFVLLLENCDAKGGHMLAERIREKIAALDLEYDGRKVRLTVSLGISIHPDNGTDKDVLIDKADQALYRAKQAGRNRTVIWSEPED